MGIFDRSEINAKISNTEMIPLAFEAAFPIKQLVKDKELQEQYRNRWSTEVGQPFKEQPSSLLGRRVILCNTLYELDRGGDCKSVVRVGFGASIIVSVGGFYKKTVMCPYPYDNGIIHPQGCCFLDVQLPCKGTYHVDSFFIYTVF